MSETGWKQLSMPFNTNLTTDEKQFSDLITQWLVIEGNQFRQTVNYLTNSHN